MYEVDRQQVAPAGNLDLDAHTYVPGPAVNSLLFDPVDAATLLLSPSARSDELFVDKCAENLTAIPVFALLDAKLEPGYDPPNLV
jgi:hypothetical protein